MDPNNGPDPRDRLDPIREALRRFYDPQTGNYGGLAGMMNQPSAAEVLASGDPTPMLGFAGTFIGPAGGVPRAMMRTANDMTKWGATSRAIRDATGKQAPKGMTGLHLGKDGQWRAEISDENARLHPTMLSGSYKLPDVLRDTDIFKHYPGLAKNTVTVRNTEPGLAGFNPNTGEIRMSNYDVLANNTEPLLHEVQHAIQNKEGWAPGGSPAGIFQDVTGRRPDSQVISPGDANMLRMAHAMYNRLAGEVEARNTETRQPFTLPERQALQPQITQDTPYSAQLLKAPAGEAQRLASMGTGQDSLLVHLAPQELSIVQQALGRPPKINPITGLPSFDPEGGGNDFMGGSDWGGPGSAAGDDPGTGGSGDPGAGNSTNQGGDSVAAISADPVQAAMNAPGANPIADAKTPSGADLSALQGTLDSRDAAISTNYTTNTNNLNELQKLAQVSNPDVYKGAQEQLFQLQSLMGVGAGADLLGIGPTVESGVAKAMGGTTLGSIMGSTSPGMGINNMLGAVGLNSFSGLLNTLGFGTPDLRLGDLDRTTPSMYAGGNASASNQSGATPFRLT